MLISSKQTNILRFSKQTDSLLTGNEAIRGGYGVNFILKTEGKLKYKIRQEELRWSKNMYSGVESQN